jgi:hypothetical protein
MAFDQVGKIGVHEPHEGSEISSRHRVECLAECRALRRKLGKDIGDFG